MESTNLNIPREIVNASDNKYVEKCPICQQFDILKYNCLIPDKETGFLRPTCSTQDMRIMCSTCSTILGVDLLILSMTNIDKYSYCTIGAYVNNKKINSQKYLLGKCMSHSKELCERFFHDSIITFIIEMNATIPDEIIIYILKLIY